MTEQSGLQLSDLVPSSSQMETTLREALCKDPGIRATSLAWGFIGSEATETLKSVLHLDVFEVLARGWCAASELHEFADRSKHPSGERSVVYLGQHAFTKTVYPTLTIAIGSFQGVSLRFTLDLTANIRSVALGICDGNITSLGSGDGDVGAHLQYDGVDLTKLDSRKVQFPAHYDFKAPGLAIA